MENLHGEDARRVGVRGKRGTRYVWGRGEGGGKVGEGCRYIENTTL